MHLPMNRGAPGSCPGTQTCKNTARSRSDAIEGLFTKSTKPRWFLPTSCTVRITYGINKLLLCSMRFSPILTDHFALHVLQVALHEHAEPALATLNRRGVKTAESGQSIEVLPLIGVGGGINA